MSSGTLLGRFVSSLRSCGIKSSDGVAVALSGGPDSMALASMTVWWQGLVRSKKAPLALIVDHKLRPESTDEAQAVAAQAAALGMNARVLTVKWPANAAPRMSDKMAAAREARYALLLRACGELGRSHLLLAHHADDQAETFLLRLMHASGVLGLACMPRVAEKRTEFGRVQVVRPLLDFRKAELEAHCRRTGLAFVEDPTNTELSFHRNRIRHALAQTYLHPQPPEGSLAESPPAAAAEQRHELLETAGGGIIGNISITRNSLALDRAAAGAAAAGASSDSLVQDILMLQRRCEEAMQRQQALGDRMLGWAVVRTSVPELPHRPRQQQQQTQLQEQQEQQQRKARRCGRLRNEEWVRLQPWFIDWDSRLAKVAFALRPVPYALLDASCFSKPQETIAVGALSRMLQAVSGRKYPPPLAHTTRLHSLLLPGRVNSVFTGGGCLVKPLPRSKGRYVMCVAQTDWERVQGLLAKLPPPNEEDVARRKRKRQRRVAAKAAAAAALAGGVVAKAAEQDGRAAALHTVAAAAGGSG